MDKISLQRVNGVIFFLFATIAALYIGSAFFIPLVAGIFIATLVGPLCQALESKGVGRLLSSLLVTLFVFFATLGIGILLVVQLRQLIDDLPQLERELESFLRRVQAYVFSQTGFSPEQQRQFILNRSDQILAQLESVIQKVLGNIFTTTLHFLLLMVYLFLFLLKRHKYETFLLMYLPQSKKEKGKEVIAKTTHVAHQYLWGRIQVMTLLAIMYLITFWIFDLRHMGLLTLFGALVTVIPFVGPFVSGIVPVAMFIIAGESISIVLLFAFVVLIVQLIESYIFEPIIMGAEVHLAPITIIIAIILGNMIWGIPGMILFVPIFAIVKIVSDQLEALKPVGWLIGKPEKGPGGSIRKMILVFVQNVKRRK
ncbi:AI-2E family transporter [Cytophagaceae bacterium ABcell3]|nr:AI-2E family transporter [Cytophagaceae bacterium ABcell3]